MLYLPATLLILINLIWLMLVILGLPGNWLMVLSTVFVAWWQWDTGESGSQQMFGLATLIAIVILASLGEVFEFFAGVIGSKKAGGDALGIGGCYCRRDNWSNSSYLSDTRAGAGISNRCLWGSGIGSLGIGTV